MWETDGLKRPIFLLSVLALSSKPLAHFIAKTGFLVTMSICSLFSSSKMHLRLLTMATATTVGVSAQTVTLADMLASQNATLSILNGFLEQQQALFNTFSNTQDITVLAPSNDALSSLPSALVDRVSTDPDYLAALLSYHVLNGTYYSSQLSAASDPVYIRTLLNSSSYSNVTGGQRIVSQVSSGAVSLGSGGQSRAALQLTDYNFTGGTVHIIDAMLSLPTNLTTTLLGANLTAAVGAIQQSGLAPSLNAELEVTVFAPTNAAFEAVGNLVAGMTAAELQSVVGYHVVEGEVLYGGMLAAGVAGGKNAATVQGGAVTFREEEGGRLFVNSARVVVADVLIANGVLHVIDG